MPVTALASAAKNGGPRQVVLIGNEIGTRPFPHG